MSTALIQIVDNIGGIHMCRALFETGFQPNLISEELVEDLKLHK